MVFHQKKRRNRLINNIRRILSVTKEIDVAELRRGISRNYRMHGFSPTQKILKEFCKHIEWCRVDGYQIYSNEDLNYENELGSNEWAIVSILKEDGPIMSYYDLRKRCLEIGMNINSFNIYSGYKESPSELIL